VAKLKSSLPMSMSRFVVITIRSFPHSWHIIWFIASIKRRLAHVEQGLLTFPEHTSLPPVLSGVRVARSLIFCVDHCLSVCSYSFDHCIVYPSMYCFWLSLWYLNNFITGIRILIGRLLYYIRQFAGNSSWFDDWKLSLLAESANRY
jgi:hypothetical protein